MARVKHPHVVQILHIDKTICKFWKRERPYLVMEYIAGKTLQQLIDSALEKRKPGVSVLAPRQVAQYGVQIAGGLAVAHAFKMVHRDLKPQNVMIRSKEDEAVVLDFGLAKVPGEPDLTARGSPEGSPDYASPEQKKGGPTDTRSDVYQLGLTLYACLVGEPPFRRTHREWDVGDLSSLRRLGVPKDLETICFKCMRWDPAKRYESAQAVGDDLARFLSNEPIRAGSYTVLHKGWHWTRRNRGKMSLAGMAVLLLFALGMQLGLGAARRARALSVYATDVRQAKQELDSRNPARAIELLSKYQGAAGQAALRGWEWFYLESETDKFRSTLLGQHEGRTTGVAFSTDGQLLASVGHDGFFRLWDLAKGNLLGARHLRSPVTALVGTSLPSTFVAGTAKGEVVVIVAEQGTLVEARKTSIPGGAGVMDLNLSPDGKILTAVAGGRIYVFNDPSRPPDTVGLSLKDFEYAAISADGSTLAAATSLGPVRLLSLTARKEVGHLSRGYDRPFKGTANDGDLAYSPDGKLLASCSDSSCEVKVWDSASQIPIARKCVEMNARRVIFSGDSRRLAIACGNLTKILDTTGWAQIQELLGHHGEVLALSFAPAGGLIATGDSAGEVRLWTLTSNSGDVNRGTPGQSFTESDTKTNRILDDRNQPPSGDSQFQTGAGTPQAGRGWEDYTLGLSSDGGYLVAVHGPERLAFLGQRASTNASAFAVHGRAVLAPTIAKFFKNDFVAIGTEAGGVFLFSCDTPPRFLGECSAPTNAIYTIAFSHDGELLAAGTRNGWFEIFDTRHMQRVREFRPPFRPVSPIIFSRRDAALVAGLKPGGDGEIWNISGPRLYAGIQTRGEPIVEIASSPDGAFLACLASDGRVFLRESTSGRARELLTDVVARSPLAFTVDSRRLVAGSTDNSLRLWDVESGLEVLKLDRHKGPVQAISVDENSIGAAGAHSISVYRIASGSGAGKALPLKTVRH